MRQVWPNASEESEQGEASFEGRVLERPAPSVDFRLPAAALAQSRPEDSILFVAPRDENATSGNLGPEVDLDDGDPTPLPAFRLESEPSKLSRPSTPGAFVSPLSSQALADLDDWDDDSPTQPLPVFSLLRRRPVLALDLDELDTSLLGATTAARASRLGIVVAFLFAGLAVRALGAEAPTLEALTSMGEAKSTVITDSPRAPAPAMLAREADVASVPRVRLPAAPPPPPPAALAHLAARPSAHRPAAPAKASDRALLRPMPDLARNKSDVPHFDLPHYDRAPSLREVARL